jgi:hypothetical protein
LASQGEENIGMAMTFTLVSHLRDQLAILVKEREERRRKEEAEKERLALEVSIAISPEIISYSFYVRQAEEAKTRGTPVTMDSFKAWKTQHDKELAAIKAREDEEKMKGMTAKEREEYKKIGTRLTGAFFTYNNTLSLT